MIKLPSDPQYLKIIRSGVTHVTQLCGFTTDDCNAVTIAVDEALANIIKHTYKGATNKKIVVSLRVLKDRFEIVLRDFGKKLDLSKVKSRDLDDVRPGGLGVHLIRSTMDEVVYDNSLSDGNRLTLAKYLPGGKEESNDRH